MKTIEQNGNQSKKRNRSRGVALVMTLLTLMLMVALTLSMTIAVTSDSLINKYYRNFRSSFYAADSGANVARQYMLNQLSSNALAVGTTFSSTGAPPLSSTDGSTTLSNLISAYGTASSIDSGQGATSWPSKFNVVSSQSGTIGTSLGVSGTNSYSVCKPSFTPPNAGTGTMNTPPSTGYDCGANLPVCTGTCTGFAITDFDYTYPYMITAIGQSLGSEQQIVEDAGNLVLDVHVGPAGGTQQSFAGWGMFIDQYTECSGDLVAGTITGPVFTNGAWTFGSSGSYTFTGKIGSVSSTFGYDFNSGCVGSAATSDKSGSQTIAPTFQAGTNLGATAVPLPTNSFSQKEAVVDETGTNGTITNAQMNASLKTYNGTAYPAAGTTNPGVYMPYSTTTVGGVTTNTMTGGGIYVEGNANSVMLTASSPTIGGTVHSQQVYTITQGTTVTTVTVDSTSNTTTLASKTGSGSTTTTTISGVPENDTTGTPAPGTMLYVDGNIGTTTSNGLSGPGQGVAGIQNGTALTVAAAGDVNITGDVLYKEEPVTFTQNQIAGTPMDTLIPGNNYGQVLGIFTATGNVNLYNQQSNGNLEIDASIATISAGGSGGIINPGSSINTLTIVGGRIQNTIQDINTTTRNVLFDQRFAQGGFAPPWFPSTTITAAATDSVASVTSTVNRTQWLAVY